jgi:Fur family transcriptional regulator, stress-responsive regulator
MLRAAGLRVTGVRLAALDALAGGGHLSADEVVTEVRERLGAVSTQAGYDVLRALAAAGLARR